MFTRQRPQPALPRPVEEPAEEPKEHSINDLTLQELKAFHEQVGQVLAQRTAQAREDFRTDFLAKLDLFGMSIEDLRPTKPKKERKPRDVTPRYRDPSNPENTWSGGKGRKPKWLADLLEAGRSLEEFEIAGASPPATGPA